jgi:hypothetical protein
MNKNWFKRLGWFHVPTSIRGAIVTLLALAFCIQVFLAVDRRAHSVSDTFYGAFPCFACAFLLLNWVASNTSQKDRS